MSKLFSILGPLLGSGFQQYQADQANQANRGDRKSALDFLREQFGGINDEALDVIGTDADAWNEILYGKNVGGGLGTVASGLASGAITDEAGAESAFGGTRVPGYFDRLTTGLEMVEGEGAAAREDLDLDYEGLQGQALHNLTSRGLDSSTVLPTVAAGIQRNKDRSSRALEEDINRRKLNVFSDLSGDFLSALEEAARQKTGLGLGRLDMLGGQTRDIADVMTGYPTEGPPPPNWGDTFMGIGNNLASIEAAEQAAADSNDWLGPALTGGAFDLGSVGILGGLLR